MADDAEFIFGRRSRDPLANPPFWLIPAVLSPSPQGGLGGCAVVKAHMKQAAN
jgi:hypothetical protein